MSPSQVIHRWCMYDWANSVYSLTITTAVFPIYFTAITTQADGNTALSFWDITLPSSIWYSYTLSLSFLFIVVINPLLSGISDYSGNRKTFLNIFLSIGALSCMGLFFFDGIDNVRLGLLLFGIATIGYAGSLVFYNAYLPEITAASEYDKVSARGFAYGYIGSVILLLINLAVIQFPTTFGLAEGTLPSRLSFLMVGVWWLCFGWYASSGLPSLPSQRFSMRSLRNGYIEINHTLHKVTRIFGIKFFLISFFFLSIGFQTIMYLATIFGSTELHIPTAGLIGVVLIIQLVAIAGAFLMAKVSARLGNAATLALASVVCIVICISAFLIQSAMQFYLLAVLVGLLMGGVQSLSRSTFAKLIPNDNDNASFYSFYELVEKVAIVTGTATYGIIEQVTGTMRNSALFLSMFFLLASAGFFILHRKVRLKKA